jgi:probable rRNA maturation factor
MRIDTQYISIVRKTKGKLPSLPFVEIAEAIVGKKYELCIAFVGRQESRQLNNEYRQKDYPTNVLSFPYSAESGDICINLEKVRRDAPLFDKTYTEFLLHIVVHGLLHLRGLDHGPEMEALEEKYIKKFS